MLWTVTCLSTIVRLSFPGVSGMFIYALRPCMYVRCLLQCVLYTYPHFHFIAIRLQTLLYKGTVIDPVPCALGTMQCVHNTYPNSTFIAIWLLTPLYRGTGVVRQHAFLVYTRWLVSVTIIHTPTSILSQFAFKLPYIEVVGVISCMPSQYILRYLKCQYLPIYSTITLDWYRYVY